MLRMQEMTFPGFKFQKFSGGVHPQTPPPIHAWYIGHKRGLQPLLSPSNILSHRKVPFQKMPPHGKILKKGPVLEVRPGLNIMIFETFSGWKFLFTSFRLPDCSLQRVVIKYYPFITTR
jgi:hypothetical protein